MSWVVAGVALGSAALGAYQGEQQRKAQAEANQAQAEMAAAQTQYSPWTGMGAGQANIQPVTGSALGGALQGGLSGAMFGSQLKTANAEQAKLAAETDAMKPPPVEPIQPASTLPDWSSGGPMDEEKRRRMAGLA